METTQNKSNVQKSKIGYYLAWIAIIAGVLAAINNHLSTVQIPKKDDYKG
jgi:uncharacterized membrane protein YagU involved in acid resistance